MPTRTTTVGIRSKMKTRTTALDFAAVTVSDVYMNPTRVVGEFSLRVVNYGGRISFRVEQELTGTGVFTCTASHKCGDTDHPQTQFNGDTAEGALEKALGYYADFLRTPQAKALQPDLRLKPVPEYVLGGFDRASLETWMLRGNLDG